MIGIINIGDVIRNHAGQGVVVTSVVRGHHGLKIEGEFELGGIYEDYLPFELPPSASYFWRGSGWFGWVDRAEITLPNGVKLGTVCGWHGSKQTIEQLDSQWERTAELMREEQADELQE